jgi:hypothetical protein
MNITSLRLWSDVVAASETAVGVPTAYEKYGKAILTDASGT